MDLYLARHGQTDLNIGDHYQGISDLPLNATGREQAQALERAVPQGVECLVVSPQLRARQTAEPLVTARGLPVWTLDAFRERDFGVWEGLNPEQARALDPAFFDRGGLLGWDEHPPDAEPLPALVQRTGAGLREVYARHPGQTVLLVVHGFVIRALRYQLEGLSPPELKTMARPMNGELFHYSAAAVERWLERG